MKQLKGFFTFSVALLLVLSLIAGFFCSYIFSLLSVCALLLTSILIFIAKEIRLKSKVLKFTSVIFAVFFVFHIGLALKMNVTPMCFEGKPKDFSSSKFNQRPISLEKIEQTFPKNEFKIDTLRKIDFENKKFYIKRISSRNSGKGLVKMLIVSGIHGSETANVYAIPKILEYIQSQNLQEKFYFEIVYAANPVGISLFNRYNECNCNINNDFEIFKTDGAKVLRDLMKKTQFDFVLDLHEGPYDGHYVINSTSFSDLKNKLVKRFKEANIPVSPMMGNSFKDFLFRYELENPIAKIKKLKTFDMYASSQNVQNVLSESNGLENDFENRIEGHLIVFQELIKAIEEN